MEDSSVAGYNIRVVVVVVVVVVYSLSALSVAGSVGCEQSRALTVTERRGEKL